jgi:hypothetical protein
MPRTQHLQFAIPALLALAAPAQAADVTVTLPAGDGFVIEDNTGTIERLRVDEATGNISRNGALFVHTTGAFGSTFVGESAGNTSMTGNANSAFGQNALHDNTTGYFNSAFGHNAMYFNTSGKENSAFGKGALTQTTTGSRNTAFGTFAAFWNSTGSSNSAFGARALQNNTTGLDNSAFGHAALHYNTTGSYNSAFGEDALRSNTTGRFNSGFGVDALRTNRGGFENSAFGGEALVDNFLGYQNSAFGAGALRRNTDGYWNSAFGAFAMEYNKYGTANAAFGAYALFRNDGGSNAAFGFDALRQSTGSGNTAIGFFAGSSLITGDNNIYLNNRGVNGDNGSIRIGDSSNTNGTHIAGIHNVIIPGPGQGVVVNSNGLLGTSAPSSVRYKEAVRDMGEASEVLMRLRPVTFRYREDLVDADGGTEYGLIAEEVADVFPELVIEDAEARPGSVRYSILAPMLLNEMQKQQRTIEAQDARLESQAAEIESLRAQQQERIAGLTARIERLEGGPQLARVEAIR